MSEKGWIAISMALFGFCLLVWMMRDLKKQRDRKLKEIEQRYAKIDAQPLADTMTDDDIIALLASIGVDADDSKYGFKEKQHRMSTPIVRQLLQKYHAAQQDQP